MKKYTFDFYNSANLKAYNLNDTMRYQLSILDKMDPITKKHSESVANLVCRICEYLGFNWQVTIHSTMNAYLHDVGKLAIPQEILNKPGKLTDQEYTIMKTHTTKGYNICMKDIIMNAKLCMSADSVNGLNFENVRLTQIAKE